MRKECEGRKLVAKRLKGLRKEYNSEQKKLGQTEMTQEKFAEMLDVDRTTYGQIELGNRDLSVPLLMQICDFYHVSADYVLGYSDMRKHPDNAVIGEVQVTQETLSQIEKRQEELRNNFKNTLNEFRDEINSIVEDATAIMNREDLIKKSKK